MSHLLFVSIWCGENSLQRSFLCLDVILCTQLWSYEARRYYSSPVSLFGSENSTNGNLLTRFQEPKDTSHHLLSRCNNTRIKSKRFTVKMKAVGNYKGIKPLRSPRWTPLTFLIHFRWFSLLDSDFFQSRVEWYQSNHAWIMLLGSRSF